MKKITLLLMVFTLFSWMGVNAQNLIEGGDFDRAYWQDYSKPASWTFENVQVKLIETPSYPGNKGWMYVDITPAADGKMRLFVEDYAMQPDYKAMEVAAPAKYAISFWAKSEAGCAFKVSMPWYGADGATTAWTSPEIKVNAAEWKQYTVFTDVAPEGTKGAGLEVLFEAEGGVVSFDDFSVEVDNENHEAGEILVDGKKPGETPVEKNDYTDNLIEGGDFDRAYWQDNNKPSFWTFDKVQVKLIETASYPGNKGWMYVDVTPAAEGKMRLFKEDDSMNPDYNSMKVAAPAKYAVMFWAKSEGATTFKINMPWYGADGKSVAAWTSPEIKVNAAEWKQYLVFTDVAPEGTKGAGLEVLFEAEGGVVSLDDFGVYADKENHEAGEILVDGKKQEETPVEQNDYTANLIEGGDFDRAYWQDNNKPSFWSFDKAQVKLIETASYPGNKGWMYVDVTPAADGKMRLFKEDDSMNPDYNSMEVAAPAKYAVMFWAKSEAGCTFKLNMPWYGADGKSEAAWTSPEIKVEGNTWKQYLVFTDVAPEGTKGAGLEVLFEAEGGVVSFDDFGVYADKENHEAGEILVDGKKQEETPVEKNDYTDNLIEGGDFDRAYWQDDSKPSFWSFDKVQVKLIETASYPGNKGWMYVDVTPVADGKMRLFKEDDSMNPDYNSMEVAAPAKYAVMFWAKSEGATTFKLNMPWYGADGKSEAAWTSPEIKVEGNTWKKYLVFTDVAPEGTKGAGLEVLFEAEGGVVSFDDFGVYADKENHKAGEIIVEGEENPDPKPEPDPDQPTTGNLFEYGDFEKMNELNNKNFAGWYITNTAYFKVSNDVPAESTGKQSLSIYPGSTYRIMTNDQGKENILNVEENTTYVLSFWAKGNNANDKFSARFHWYGNDEEVGEPTYVVEDGGFSQSWKLHTYEVQVPWDVNSAAFVISFSTDNDFVFFDDIKMVAKSEETGITSINGGNALIKVNNGQVTVEVKEPVAMEIYSITGKLVLAEQLSSTSTFALHKGAYIIKLGNKAHKVLVK